MDKEYIIKNNIKTFTIKNYIDGEEIIKKAKEFKEIESDEKYYILKDILDYYDNWGLVDFTISNLKI